jgi:uncharacterized heparinase superfamily protein
MTYLMRLLLDTENKKLKTLVDKTFTKMQRALACFCHPDGQISLFNDSAFYIYNDPGDLLGPEPPPESGPWVLQDAGYYGYRGEDGSYIICDAGPIGPDYIPGHGHGDIFSFELSLKGQRVIVDSGIFDYVPGEMRQYCRSTRAHNTVEVDGQDQCEFWDTFRVARRGYPHDIRWKPASDGFHLSGWHDAYRRLPGVPTHHRTVEWDGRASRLKVRDRVKARRAVAAVSRLHLHPLCRVMRLRERDALIEYSEGSFEIMFTGAGKLSREDSLYCPEFGHKEPNTTLAFTFDGKDTETAFTIVSL